MASAELIVCGWLRSTKLDILKDIVSLIILYYPKCMDFDGNTMNLKISEKYILTEWLINVFDLANKSCELSSKLLYNYKVHGTTGKDFHKKCNNFSNTLTIIQTVHNHIFGGFLSDKVQTATQYWDDPKAFLFVIRSSLKEKPDPQIFIRKRYCYAYMNYYMIGPQFGQSDLCLFYGGMGYLDDNFCDHTSSNFDDNGNLKGNVLCGGNAYNPENKKYIFNIKEMNTFNIAINIENARNENVVKPIAR